MATAHTTATAQELEHWFGKFREGDRVMRQKLLGDVKGGYLRGRVHKVRPNTRGNGELYDVLWDHDTTKLDKGYLAHGLTRELVAL